MIDKTYGAYFASLQMTPEQTAALKDLLLKKKYLARAQTILPPDQLTAFDKFLASQRDMQAMGMKMAVKMFGKSPGQ